MHSFPLFQQEKIVVLVLNNPRESIWGRLVGLDTPGVAIRGFDLRQWEDCLGMAKREEYDMLPIGTKFYPMHRVESLYLDEPASGVSSLTEEFRNRTGREPAMILESKES